MEAERGTEYSIIAGIPYKVDSSLGYNRFVIDRDVMEIQAYRYRIKNLKKQNLKITLIIVLFMTGLLVQLLCNWDKLYHLYWLWRLK